MATIAELQGRYFNLLIDRYYAQLGAQRTVTTFDLYRRTTAGAVSDLGVPNDPYTAIQTDVPCTVVGIKLTEENALKIPPQGQIQHPKLEVHCTLTDVRAGDNVVLAIDGKPYNVEKASIEGTVTFLILDHGSAQVQV